VGGGEWLNQGGDGIDPEGTLAVVADMCSLMVADCSLATGPLLLSYENCTLGGIEYNNIEGTIRSTDRQGCDRPSRFRKHINTFSAGVWDENCIPFAHSGVAREMEKLLQLSGAYRLWRSSPVKNRASGSDHRSSPREERLGPETPDPLSSFDQSGGDMGHIYRALVPPLAI
jgi:hypothetical protein